MSPPTSPWPSAWPARPRRAGARFIALPEMYHFRSTGKPSTLPGESIPGPSTRGLQAIAAEFNAAILAGSVCEAIAGSFKVHNTSVLIGPDGGINATYRKIHLFDVEVDGVAIRESDWYVPGDTPTCATVLGHTVGLSICYDLRFPELYRRYADERAEMLTVPASFTATSGAAHWESLLRARAIENQAFVLAPGQTGPGSGGVHDPRQQPDRRSVGRGAGARQRSRHGDRDRHAGLRAAGRGAAAAAGAGAPAAGLIARA